MTIDKIFMNPLILYVVVAIFMVITMAVLFEFWGSKQEQKKSPLRIIAENNADDVEKISKFISMIQKYVVVIPCCYIIILLLKEINSELLEKYQNIVNNIVGFEGIVVAFTAIAVSSMIFTATLKPKEYYLFFSTTEVLNKKHMIKHFKFICLFCAVTIFFAFLLIFNQQSESDWYAYIFSIYQIMVVIILLKGIWSLNIVGDVIFSSDKFELKIINNLYKIFYKNNKFTTINNLSENALYQNIAHLFWIYEHIYKIFGIPLKLENIDSITYYDLENNEELKEKAISNAVNLTINIGLFGFILIFIGSLITLITKRIDIEIFFKKIGINFMAWIILYLFFSCLKKVPFVKKKLGIYSAGIWFDTKGYFIILKKVFSKQLKRDTFIGTVGIWRNLFINLYINRVKNIMAFYYIVLSSDIEPKFKKEFKKIIQESYQYAIDFLKYRDKYNDKKFARFLYFIPVFLGGYFYYVKYTEVPECINKFLVEFQYTTEDKEKIRKSLSGFILETSQYRNILKNGKKLTDKNKQMELNYLKKYVDAMEIKDAV